MTSSPNSRPPVSGIIQDRVTRLRLYLGFVTLVTLLLTAILLPTFSHIVEAQGETTDPESAFAQKADKVLKRVRQIVEKREGTTSKAELQQEASELASLSRITGIQRSSNNQLTVDVVVKLTERSARELESAGFPVSAHLGDMATVQVEVSRLARLAALPSVEKILATANREPLNDRARQNVGIDGSTGQRLVSQMGRGVVVAIIDSGIDFRHLDFTVPGSGGKQTRIKALLDMTVYGSAVPEPGWNYTLPGQSAAIGHLYTEADINAALQSTKPVSQDADVVKQRDKNGHGTHVAGTAAGNGQGALNGSSYTGMAPEADLIIVKASRQNSDAASFRSTDIINALQFIQERAKELNEPFVVNLSLGGHLGPHDGTDPDERAIDSLVNAGPGRAVVVAAGNEGAARIHAGGVVPTGGSLTLNLQVDGAVQFVDLYHAGADRLNVTVTRPDGATLGPVAYDPNAWSLPGPQASDDFLGLLNTNDNKGDTDPTNDQPNIFLMFKAGAPTGMWKITLQDVDGSPNQGFDAWTGGDGVMFENQADNESHLVASPGTARGAITVGSFVSRSTYYTMRGYGPGTSPGPTADGRQKPEISAPGYYLYSARSTDVADPGFGMLGTGSEAPTDPIHYTGLAGTSMASAVTAGGVALLLQANNSLQFDQIRAYLIDNSDRDLFSTPGWNSRLGFGRLNVKSAIEAVLGIRRYVISGRVLGAWNDTSIVVNLTGSQTAQSLIDADGNYSFSNISPGGNYIITPASLNYTFTPQSKSVEDLRSNQTFDFQATAKRYKISGRVLDESGNGLANVTISTEVNGSTWATRTTDSDGSFLLAELPAGGTFKLSVSTIGRTYTPSSRTFTNLQADQVCEFVRNPFQKISGRVTDSSGAPVGGIFVFVTTPVDPNVGDGQITDSQGYYSYAHASAGGNYLLIPMSPDYKFSPTQQAVSNIVSDQTVNFTASPASELGEIRFAPDNYSFVEGSNPTGIVYLTRGKNLTIPATVSYATVSKSGLDDCAALTGNASPRCDYAETAGTITFAPGETQKSIAIPIVDDSYYDPAEFFALTLSNPQGATITSGTARMWINDNQEKNGANPLDDSDFFIRQQYIDFLGREPDQAGMQGWRNVLNNCGVNFAPPCDRIEVSAGFFRSPEFQQRGYFIYRFYSVVGKIPLSEEFMPDLAKVSGFLSDEQLEAAKADFVAEFMIRNDFVSKYGAVTDPSAYVDAMLLTVGLPNHPSRQMWIDRMTNNSMNRGQVLRALVESSEVYNKYYNQAFVIMQYFGYLRRTADASYLNWIETMNQTNGDYRTMINGFMNSAEYRRRFGPN